MPGRNATGPNHQGPMTGRRMGSCGGRGQGRGGRGQGFGLGGGQRNRFRATDGNQAQRPENEELELRNLATQHENALTTIKQRLDDLEKSSKSGENS